MTQTPSSSSAGAPRGTWPMRDHPAVVWLALAAVAALAHDLVPHGTWLAVHLVLLGALTHAAVVWSTHFTRALLKTPPQIDERPQQNRRLVLLLIGTLLVLVGVPAHWWPVTVIGALAVALAVLWHASRLARRLRRAPAARFRTTVRFYLVAAAWLPVGATVGVVLARHDLGEDWEGRLLIAHTTVMLLGWIGFTVTGTLVTLWPTMLRTRMDDRAEALAAQSLPVLGSGVTIVLAGTLADARWLAVLGLLTYAAGLAWWGRALVRPVLTRPPREFATGSVSAALLWLAAGITTVTVAVAVTPDWGELGESYTGVAVVFTVGFGAQLLIGALSYLIPSVLGGGSAVVRAGQAWFDRWATARLALPNVGLAVALLPVPPPVRIASGLLVLGALTSFIPLMFGGIRAAVRTRRSRETDGPGAGGALGPRPIVWSGVELMWSMAALAVTIAAGIVAAVL